MLASMSWMEITFPVPDVEAGVLIFDTNSDKLDGTDGKALREKA